jgi:hypothetical protein
MQHRIGRSFAAAALAAAILIGAPLAGCLLAGKPVAPYLEIPPRTLPVTPAPFSPAVFACLAALILLVILPFDAKVLLSRARTERLPPERRMPWWGWCGLGTGLAVWVLAWSRFDRFAPLQAHTFTPLWLSYILVVNALAYRRSGRCMLTCRPLYFGLLFVLSAGFWWFFEYLNRFVQNWHYPGQNARTAAEYLLLATVPFATVLPAVMGTYEWLSADARNGAGLDHFLALDLPARRAPAVAVLVVAAAGLAGIALWPDYLFPLLWVAPLLVVTSVQSAFGFPTIFRPVRIGHWRRIYRLAAAALICGGFWEMWNYFSLAKWTYQVPFVQRFHIFEMPLLGYAGYIPFGLECAVFADALAALLGQRTNGANPRGTAQTDS